MTSLMVGLPFRLIPPYSDDDISDRMHHRWTVVLLLSCTFITGYEIWVGYPLRCWCPAQFTDSHCNYTEAYCWIEDNYYIPPEDFIPDDVDDRDEIEIKYYQWVSIILLVLALFYKLPNILWKMMNTRTGVSIEKIVKLCGESQIGQERNQSMKTLSEFLDHWLKSPKNPRNGVVYGVIEKLSACFCFCLGKKTGSYLCGLYLDIKLCYLAVSVGLLFLLNKMLAMDYTIYGFEIISNLAGNTQIRESPRFPRGILCDFQIRQLQNFHRYTVQCVLAINLFNEKMFAFLWFWFFLMILFALYSYIKWAYHIISPGQRFTYVEKYVKLIEHHKRTERFSRAESEASLTEMSMQPDTPIMSRNAVVRFSRDYLTMDGVFVLRMLEYNTNEMVILDLMKCLIQNWTKDQ